MVQATATLVKQQRHELLDGFGRFMVPDLVRISRSKRVAHTNWKALDYVEHLPTLLQKIFPIERRTTDDQIEPVRALRLRYSEAAVVYLSPHHLCAFLRGIIEGMGDYFKEPLVCKETICQLKGGQLCRFSVVLDDPNLKNFVDIAKEFEILTHGDSKLKLFNRFRGVPLTGEATVMNYTTDEVLINAPSGHISAMAQQSFVHISMPHLSSGLKAEIKKTDAKRRIAVLHNFSLTDGPMGKRSNLRVEPKKGMPIESTLQIGKEKFQAVIIDLSVGGVSLKVQRAGAISEKMLFIPVRVVFPLPKSEAPAAEAKAAAGGNSSGGDFRPKKSIRWMKQGDSNERSQVQHIMNLPANIMSVQEIDHDHKQVRLVFAQMPVKTVGKIKVYVEERRQEIYASKKRRNRANS